MQIGVLCAIFIVSKKHQKTYGEKEVQFLYKKFSVKTTVSFRKTFESVSIVLLFVTISFTESAVFSKDRVS